MNNVFTNEQRVFIEEHFKQTKQDKIIEDMSKFKSFIPTELMDSKVLSDDDVFMDMWDIQVNRADNRIHQCMCGRKIKNQYLLTHKQKDITLSLGEAHYKKYCGLSVGKFEKMINAHKQYIAEVEELETLISQGEYERQKYLLYFDELPQIMKEQLNLKLPLTNKQIESLEKERNINKNIIHCIKNMQTPLVKYLDELDFQERKTFIIHLKNGDIITELSQLKNIDYGSIRDRDLRGYNSIIELKADTIDNNDVSENNYISSFQPMKRYNELNLFNQNSYGVSRDPMKQRFLDSIKDEEVRLSIINNTKEGKNKLTRRDVKGFPSKIQRQVDLGFSLSDQQMERFLNSQDKDSDFWKYY